MCFFFIARDPTSSNHCCVDKAKLKHQWPGVPLHSSHSVLGRSPGGGGLCLVDEGLQVWKVSNESFTGDVLNADLFYFLNCIPDIKAQKLKLEEGLFEKNSVYNTKFSCFEHRNQVISW